MEDAPRFSGDPWTEDPDQFWRDVRLFFRKVDVDKRCADFDLLLAANSAADKWHRKLPAVIRDDWDALEKAFRTQWIRAPPPRLSDAEALEVILRGVPTLDDLTKYDSVARGGPSTARYQLWIRKLYNDAMVEEYSDGLADQVRSKLPRPLRDLIEPVQTWKELLDGVCAVNTTRLRERVRDAIEDSKKRNKIRTVVAQRIDIDPERGNVRGAAGTTTLDSLGQQPAALSLRVQHDPMTAFASPPNPTTYPQWGWGPLQYPPSGHSSYTPRAPQAPWAPGSPLGPVHEYIYHTTGF
ncbi:hypothetical protein C8Q79DRAFT_924209 [Trametes meyenii]|nr:hypothetical protein C8Q79DRAFT_924209 [Trametes meyenii]